MTNMRNTIILWFTFLFENNLVCRQKHFAEVHVCFRTQHHALWKNLGSRTRRPVYILSGWEPADAGAHCTGNPSISWLDAQGPRQLAGLDGVCGDFPRWKGVAQEDQWPLHGMETRQGWVHGSARSVVQLYLFGGCCVCFLPSSGAWKTITLKVLLMGPVWVSPCAQR